MGVDVAETTKATTAASARDAGVAIAETRIVDAALQCIAKWGILKTNLDDVARRAGYSRATIYRLFPGGKDAVLDAVARTEVSRFFARLVERFRAAESLEDLLVAGMTEAGRSIREHDALQFLLAYEPETVLPRLAFNHCDEVLASASAVAAPYLTRWLKPGDALRAAEWATRLVLSYSSVRVADVDMADETSVRRMVRTFVLPGLVPLLVTNE